MVESERRREGGGSDGPGARALPFEEVYFQHGRAVHRYCLSLALDPDLAEELAAQTLAQALAAYDRTRPDPQGTRAWLLRIARNVANDHFRRQRRSRLLLHRLVWSRPPTPDPQQQAVLNTELRAVLKAMSAMSLRDRDLIGLRAAGLPYAEVGRQLRISENAATVATRRAIAKLRRTLEEWS